MTSNDIQCLKWVTKVTIKKIKMKLHFDLEANLVVFILKVRMYIKYIRKLFVNVRPLNFVNRQLNLCQIEAYMYPFLLLITYMSLFKSERKNWFHLKHRKNKKNSRLGSGSEVSILAVSLITLFLLLFCMWFVGVVRLCVSVLSVFAGAIPVLYCGI